MNYSRRRFLKNSGLITAAAWMPLHFRCAAPARKPNVVILFSDEMDLSYLGYGGGNYPTPNFDQLAGAGMHFTNAYASAAMCTPSRYGLLTGQYPGRCTHPKFKAEFPADQPYSIGWNSFLYENIQTLPRLLSKNGYVTGMAGKWHLGDPELEDDEFLANVDADAEINTSELNTGLKKHQERLQKLVSKQGGFDYAKSVIWTNNDDFKVKKLRYHNFPWVTKGAVDLLKKFKKQDKPFFLYVASTACHGPHHGESLDNDMRNTQEGGIEDVLQYSPPVAEIKENIKNLSRFEQYKYAGMAELDHQVGILLNKLKELQLFENTIVIFMADHNVEPGKASCYQKGLHVPAIIKWPNKIKPGSVCDALMQNVDIMPTILDVVGIGFPPGKVIDGKSLLPLIDGKAESVRQYIFADSGYARSVANGKYKYIAFRSPKDVIREMQEGKVKYAPNFLNVFKQQHSHITMEYYPGYFDQDQFYDLETDPYEQNNLAYDPKYGAVLEKMKEVLAKHLKSFDHPFDLNSIPFMETNAYRKLVANTKSIGTEFIPWWKGRKINFPPK